MLRGTKQAEEEGGGIRVWGGGKELEIEIEKGEKEGKREKVESECINARERELGS